MFQRQIAHHLSSWGFAGKFSLRVATVAIAAVLAGTSCRHEGHEASPVSHSPTAIESDGTNTPPRNNQFTNSVGMTFVYVPAGSYLMGADDNDLDRAADEQPQHAVQISEGVWVGTHEVTQSQYLSVMRVNPARFQDQFTPDAPSTGSEFGRSPVEQVSWENAVEFCRRLTNLPEEHAAGRYYRLPTEAEWEYACRAGTTTPFSCGPRLSTLQANFDGREQYRQGVREGWLERPAVVGSYQANPFGLHDLHGNVWEWCADKYIADYYRFSPPSDPPGPDGGTYRVIRGGSWQTPAESCRSAFRSHFAPSVRSDIGFRVWCSQ